MQHQGWGEGRFVETGDQALAFMGLYHMEDEVRALPLLDLLQECDSGGHRPYIGQ